MLNQFAEWRQTENVDTLYETWSFPELHAVKVALPHGMHKHTKEGRPIYIRRVGICDFDAFFAAATEDRLVRYISYQMELYKYLAFPSMSRLFGRHIETNCQIFDLTKGSVTKMASR